MSYRIVRTDKEINDLLNRCSEAFEERGHPYAAGVEAGIQWLLGNTDEKPLIEQAKDA